MIGIKDKSRMTNMDAELRKRLEEAEVTIRTEIVNGIPHAWLSIAIDKATRQGIELGYKEAIAQAKEWIKTHTPCIHTHEGDAIYVHGFRHIPMLQFLADFETYMRKLWEEKK